MSAPNDDEPLHGDLSLRVVVETDTLPWLPSPSATVWRRRLHRVGPAESGQVTSLVRYDAGAVFPVHAHPEGEEILVLDGVFSDEHGDWPAGTWLLNPEGFRHAPFSRDGCLLFVKLRQAAGSDREHVEVLTDRVPWRETAVPGVDRKQLAAQPGHADSTWLERWRPGTVLGERELAGGAEYFVLEGEFSDGAGNYGARNWLRIPIGSRHRPETREGCLLYVKYGGLADLRSA